MAADTPREWVDLSDSGLLWYINRVAFHPRGFALAVHHDDNGTPTGWSLQGNGAEPWVFSEEIDDEYFKMAEGTFAQQREAEA